MIDDPPFKTIQTMTAVLLASSANMHVKSFAVGSRGRKRDKVLTNQVRFSHKPVPRAQTVIGRVRAPSQKIGRNS